MLLPVQIAAGVLGIAGQRLTPAAGHSQNGELAAFAAFAALLLCLLLRPEWLLAPAAWLGLLVLQPRQWPAHKRNQLKHRLAQTDGMLCTHFFSF